MERKEIGWINTLKAICMVLVYAYHTSVYCGYESLGFRIYSPFFVTSFFFISGYLVYRKIQDSIVTKSNQGKSVISLNSVLYKIAIPTVLFSIINYFPKTILRGEGLHMEAFVKNTILGGSLWFTSALVVSEVLLFIILSANIKRFTYYFLITATLAVFGIFIAKSNLTIWGDFNIPWFYKAGMIGTLYMTIGGGVY